MSLTDAYDNESSLSATGSVDVARMKGLWGQFPPQRSVERPSWQGGVDPSVGQAAPQELLSQICPRIAHKCWHSVEQSGTGGRFRGTLF